MYFKPTLVLKENLHQENYIEIIARILKYNVMVDVSLLLNTG